LRNPRQEAFDRLEGRYEVRVLEPSPPAVEVEPWFADDPVERGEVPAGRQLVSPAPTGDLLWEELARDDPSLAEWCSERWLASYRRLEPAPPTLVAAREALHRVAAEVVSPARQRANGKIGLRWTLGGFGTPFFGADSQLRVEGAQLIVEAGRAEERRAPLASIAEAAGAIGFEVDGNDDPLDIDPLASHFIGEWFGFVTSVLEDLRAQAPAEWEASRVQIWPEHFDAAVELGAESADGRAAVGGSPGDESHPEPYLYVAPWSAHPTAELSYAELLEAGDQRQTAIAFLRERTAALN
jgi:hypothetical protein